MDIAKKLNSYWRVRLQIVIISLSIFSVSLGVAASFLDYCDPPRKSELVVLFLGQERIERYKEAMSLIEEGYGHTLFIPALKIGWRQKSYPNYYEDTHIEVIYARQMMEQEGYQSAIMVSSPYHMRRIRMISNSVFDKLPYSLTFRGSRYVTFEPHLVLWNGTQLKRIVEEYIKIAAFYGYQFYEIFTKSRKVK